MIINDIVFADNGGFGDIYFGIDELGRRVAIKTIREASQGISTALQHAKALVRAKHANVVEVYSIENIFIPNENEPVQCILMEYIDGQTIDNIYSKKINKEECLSIGNKIIEGLKHIHNQGLIHGDLHDKNVMLTSNGQIKIIDILYIKSLADYDETKKQEKLKYDYRSLHQLLCSLIFNSELGLESVNEFRNKSGLGIPETIETIEKAFLCLEDFADREMKFIAEISQVNVAEIKEYCFRAECEIDVDELRKLMGRKCLKIKKNIDVFPDVFVVLYTTLQLDELRDEIRKVEDGHVMLQTVELKDNYTGERNYDLK
ncbi:protein kinase domain-containing protein [Runella aurantiaca]|uniref:Serine/threonine protein kinase n=1 Tax=Runella aurantiaca TaxID=2282308 RepID=A0A369IE36_9BACT|nr:protein kinase [Runella aurantiaca]RDB07928.1 serine/threonine protein kinase [Runella aurantiaca]